MIFADLMFLYIFIPVFALAYFIAGKLDSRSGSCARQNCVLLVFSLLFYAWGEPVFIILLVISAFITWCASLTGKENLGVAALIAFLVFFKYGNLLISMVPFTGVSAHAGIHLPIGISFYTFQSISYLLDVRNKKYEPARSFPRLLLYISMFPQLIAGPMVRYSDIEHELDERDIDSGDVAAGVFRFINGLGKKVILADQLSVITDATMGAAGSPITADMAWLGLVSFALQIYFDFSAYSDMAIGIGRCVGFHFPENFDKPYLCSSVTDFWRRWHMTLGTFFRDYVYIPMGGNRVPAFRWIANVLIVWILTGFWHGAHWNYLIWGLYFGLLLLIERCLHIRDIKGAAAVIWRFVALFFVVFGWSIFYFEDFGMMRDYIRALFFAYGASDPVMFTSTVSQHLILLTVSCLLCLPWPKKIRPDSAVLRCVWSAFLLIVSTVMLVGATNHPFLYTRF